LLIPPPSGGTSNAVFLPITNAVTNLGFGRADVKSGPIPQTVNPQGVGTILTLASSGLAFNAQVVGTTSAPQLQTLTNNGAAALAITSSSVGGDF
jgi:hypothetical protein